MKRPHTGIKQRWVIKIGSALITAEGKGIDQVAIQDWVKQISQLCDDGHEIILVSSGAVAEGMARLNWTERPAELFKLQAAAAVGQMGMVQSYESFFQAQGRHTAQILLTHDDLSNRERYLNARSTLCSLLELGVIPIINENDSVATEEIRFGDNDSLGGLVSNLIAADFLVILTDQAGLFSADPRTDPDAELVSEGLADDPKLLAMASSAGGLLGRGGMQTKLRAAHLAARSGASTLIAYGREANVLTRLASGEPIGTWLYPNQAPITARKRWLASHLQMRGCVYLDEGAVLMLKEAGKSLLAVGVTQVEGDFKRGEMVLCLTPEGKEIARGLINYSAEETCKIMGQPSKNIESILGYVDEPSLIHRDNLVLV
ncbi:glutamate 5-kinase [Candidatus Venteria ishoeyi]|uniref:Glutamate 5-kinase n=1 Tax=Candidatus Venteria ishoeyi TaxID=1899563 RepID=A0A1H6FEV0_9GAMM|nr:glutamate 5-kinase [Candidatus Venteria ishoeyi]MDM8545052.1 glutamate 5-kinase [Candidatus Venteria ishoeyi]SEH08183.1 Glutamate 5-kinase [Candidatus Venteria ishoeyi]